MTKYVLVVSVLLACKSSSEPASKSKLDGDPPVGVWLGIGEHMKLGAPLLTDLKLDAMVAWPDGHFSMGLPYAGLADFDQAAWARDVRKNASLGGRPGAWTRDGDGWQIKYDDGGSATIKADGDALKIDRAKLWRVKDVTGATLDGVYTWWSVPDDPLLGAPGCQQLVVFKPTGQFDDRGGFARTCPAATDDPDAPGVGTYELRDFSLILRYADGRVAKHLITGPAKLDLHADNANAIIAGRLWQRRTAPIADRVAAAPPPAPAPTPAAAPVATNTTTFGGATFATPPGTKQEAENALAFTTDSCLIALNSGALSSGDLAGDFATAWKTLVEGDPPPQQQGKTPSGLPFAAGGAQTAGGYRAMFVFAVGGQLLRVVLASPTEAQLAGCGIETMMSSIRAN